MSRTYLAFDLGAESGRALAGIYDGDRLTMEELHRFPNEPVRVGGSMHWDVLRLWHEMRKGLQKAGTLTKDLAGIAVDTWGVDYALLAEDGSLLGNPYHYRDERTDGMLERAKSLVGSEAIYDATGVQFMQINTLYQLLAAQERQPEILNLARHFLTIPDLLNYWLTGRIACEFTNATTTQMYDPRSQQWARPLLEQLGIPTHFLPEVVQPGTRFGSLRPELAAFANVNPAEVIAPACHDTGSAVAAVKSNKSAFISSGTWSLLGAEIPKPIVNDEALRLNFTNEGGVGGTIRLLKNISGLWLLQGCRKEWADQGQSADYAELVAMAGPNPVLRSLVDPNDPSFLHPASMPQAIRNFCLRTGQPAPERTGEFVQTIFESLALMYRSVLESLEKLTGTTFEEIRVVGGGARNRLLNQFTANATSRRVIAGPVEATALGNIAMQMVATGAVDSIEAARDVIDRSFTPDIFEPERTSEWESAYQRFCSLRMVASA